MALKALRAMPDKDWSMYRAGLVHLGKRSTLGFGPQGQVPEVADNVLRQSSVVWGPGLP